MKTDELTAVGAIFTLIITTSMYFSTQYKTEKRLDFLEKENFEAKSVAVEQHTKAKIAESKLKKLEADIEEIKPLIRIKDELRSYTIEEIATGLWLGWTESTWNYSANHQGLYSNFCGNMPWYWDDFLRERGVNSNSAAACIEIYNYYKEIHGNRYKAIKAYKGIVKNTYIIDRSLHLRNIIYNILLEEKKKGYSWLQ